MGGARSTPHLAALTTAAVLRAGPVVGWLESHRRAIDAVGGLVVLGVTLGLFVADRAPPRYVDESDNLLGGQLVARGYRLYTDFFSQHMPLPYLATAFATLLGAHDLPTYRTFFAVAIAAVFAAVLVHFRARLSSVFLYVLVLSVGLGHPLFSGYMVLADHMFALALMVIVLFVLAQDVRFSVPQQLAISLCCFVAIQSTLISIYPIGLISVYYVVRKWLMGRGQGPRWSDEARFVGILVAPHVVLLLGLLVQGTLGSLWEQAFVFNQQYYSRYDIGGDPVSILRNSVADFGGLIVQYLRPSGLREVETVLLVSNFAAVLVAWRTRGRLFGAFYMALIVLSRMRGAGYHGSPYFVMSFLSIALVLTFAWQFGGQWLADLAGSNRRGGVRLTELAGGVMLLAYVGFVGLFYHDIGGFYVRLPRGQGLQSPYSAVVEAATLPSDRLWAAPFEPDIYVDTGRLPASPYWYYHAWLSDSPQITAGVLRDLQAVRPPVVIFRADKEIPWSFPLPTPAQFGRTVFAYIQQAYEPADAQDPLLRDVYLRRDEADVLRGRLAAARLLPAP